MMKLTSEDYHWHYDVFIPGQSSGGDEMKIRKIHSFGKTNPHAKVYGNFTERQPVCGIYVLKEYVTNKQDNVTCGNCLRIGKALQFKKKEATR